MSLDSGGRHSAITGFNPEYFAELAKLEAAHFWFRSRNRLITWAIAKYFPTAHNLLEIGCGTGFVLSGIQDRFPQLVLTGSELYSDGLAFASERLRRARLLQMDAREIPFISTFDVIGAFDVLEHIEEDEKVLREMHKAARLGIVITVPQHRFLWSQQDDYACHCRRYSARELEVKLRRAGFEPVRMTSFVSLLLPLMLAARFKKRKPVEDYDGMAELRLNGMVNAALEKVMDVEGTFIRGGVSFPAGGSLLIVAQKNKISSGEFA